MSPENPVSWNNHRRLIAALCVFGLICAQPAFADEKQKPCYRCADSLLMNGAQWKCLTSQLDFYITRPNDPSRIATIGCDFKDRAEPPPDTNVHPTQSAMPPIRPTTVMLSRGQLICLRKQANAHGGQVPRGTGGKPVDLKRLCGPATIGAPR